jgi:hypothetical protein
MIFHIGTQKQEEVNGSNAIAFIGIIEGVNNPAFTNGGIQCPE